MLLNNKPNYYSLFSLVGFSLILLIPLHNYIYGNELVLISAGSHYNYNVPINTYYTVFIDLLFFEYNENLKVIITQFLKWIKPLEIHYVFSVIILFYLLIRSNPFYLKVICLLALSQHFVLLIYEPEHRYAYLAWILNIIAVIYFIKNYIFSPILHKYSKKK